MASLQLSNPFAALEHKKAKKKKEKSEREKRKKDKKDTLELEKAIFDQPQTTANFSWADADDDEPMDELPNQVASNQHAEEADADSEHEIIDLEQEFGVELGKDEDAEGVDEESDGGPENEKQDLPVPILKKKLVAAAPERQLSKKELKKKEMDELNAVLAELGIDTGTADGEDSKGSKKKKKKGSRLAGTAAPSGQEDQGSSSVLSETVSKSASLEADVVSEEDGSVEAANGDVNIETLKTRLSRKKSGSKKSTAANLAAAEAKARAKKKGSKKDKSKFNQAPPRN